MSIISELSKLIDAGFTKDDIAKFYASKEHAPEESKVPEQPKEPEPKNEFDSLTSQISELTKLLQTSNIFKDEQPKPRTIDDIFESMFADERDKED